MPQTRTGKGGGQYHNKKTKNYKKRWTKDEDAFVEESWGTIPLSVISRRLGRSRVAVESRVRQLGLGKYTDNSEWIPMTVALQTLFGRETGGDEQRRAMQRGLPYREVRYGLQRRPVRAVYIPELWEFLYRNRRKVSLANLEPNIFGEEPDWVKEKRRIDIDEALYGKRGGHNAQWETWEDEKFRKMMKKGVTIRDAAKELRKTERALIVRRKDLGIEERFVPLPRKRWTDEEVETLLISYEKGMSWRQIGDLLDRGAWACEQKYKKLQNPGYFQKNNYGDKHHIEYRGGAASAQETREVMYLHSIGALSGFEEAPEIEGGDADGEENSGSE